MRTTGSTFGSGRALRRRRHRELAGQVPADGPLRLQHAHHVAEHRDAGEGVLRVRFLGSGHDPNSMGPRPRPGVYPRRLMVTLLTGVAERAGRRVAALDCTTTSWSSWSRRRRARHRLIGLVHLAAGDHDAARQPADERGRHDANAVLDAATSSGVDHVVLLSSAMVYGAWPNNPVPLTEDAPLRPDPGFAFVEQVAQVEQMADAWRTAVPGRRVAVLRPALALAADGTSSVVRALAAGLGTRIDEDDPPAQFLHLDDLASAVVLAHEQRLDGVYNVAADGWIPGETVRALAGRPPRLRLPSGWPSRSPTCRWRFQRGPIPPGLRPYTRHPWLVASDRLRGRRVGADDDERAGVRRGHRGQVVDDAHPEAEAGVVVGGYVSRVVGGAGDTGADDSSGTVTAEVVVAGCVVAGRVVASCVVAGCVADGSAVDGGVADGSTDVVVATVTVTTSVVACGRLVVEAVAHDDGKLERLVATAGGDHHRRPRGTSPDLT